MFDTIEASDLHVKTKPGTTVHIGGIAYTIIGHGARNSTLWAMYEHDGVTRFQELKVSKRDKEHSNYLGAGHEAIAGMMRGADDHADWLRRRGRGVDIAKSTRRYVASGLPQ